MASSLQILTKKRAWTPDQVTAVFAEHGDAAPRVLAELADTLDLVGKPLAYKTIFHVLQHLNWHPTLDAGPLVPLLRRFVEHEPYDPDKLMQFAAVRCQALLLLARRKDPAAKACLERWATDFPIPRTKQSAAGVAELMCEAVNSIGDTSLVAPMTAMLDTLCLDHSERDRKNLFERSRSLLAFR